MRLAMEENFHTKSYICPQYCVFWLWMFMKGALQWTAACRGILKSSKCSSFLLYKAAGSPHSVLLHQNMHFSINSFSFLLSQIFVLCYNTDWFHLHDSFICGPQKLLCFFFLFSFPAVKKQHQCKMEAELLWLIQMIFKIFDRLMD